MYSPISIEPFAVALFTPNKENNLGHRVTHIWKTQVHTLAV